MPSGGKRDGSGRPSINREDKRVQISISVSPDTMRRVQELREQGVKVGQVVDELIRDYFENRF